jgi:hypothetical protein
MIKKSAMTSGALIGPAMRLPSMTCRDRRNNYFFLTVPTIPVPEI